MIFTVAIRFELKILHLVVAIVSSYFLTLMGFFDNIFHPRPDVHSEPIPEKEITSFPSTTSIDPLQEDSQDNLWWLLVIPVFLGAVVIVFFFYCLHRRRRPEEVVHYYRGSEVANEDIFLNEFRRNVGA